MSLKAIQLASAGNPVSRLVNNKKLPLICATAMATIHFVLAFRITAKRLSFGDDTNETKPGTPFDYFRRTQMNVAEYNGALLAALLFCQYKLDTGSEMGKVGRIGSLLIVCGTIIYIPGYSSQRSEQASQGRVVGATFRYL
eukprot:493402_1